MLTITLKNSAGVLDTVTAYTGEEAVLKAIVLLQGTEYLNPGDSLTIEGYEQEKPE